MCNPTKTEALMLQFSYTFSTLIYLILNFLPKCDLDFNALLQFHGSILRFIASSLVLVVYNIYFSYFPIAFLF